MRSCFASPLLLAASTVAASRLAPPPSSHNKGYSPRQSDFVGGRGATRRAIAFSNGGGGATWTKKAHNVGGLSTPEETKEMQQPTTVTAMTWMGVSIMFGSIGLVAGGVAPETLRPSERTFVAALTALTFGAPLELAANFIAERAGSKRPLTLTARTLAARFATLSDAAQGLVIATASLIAASLAWIRYGPKVAPLSLAIAPASIITASMYAKLGRKPRAVHGWMPFVATLCSSHALFFEILANWDASLKRSARDFGRLISVWAALSACIAAAALHCLSLRAARQQTFIGNVPGLAAIASIAVAVDAVWVAVALFHWATHSVSVRWGLGLVAFSASLVEFFAAKCCSLSNVPGGVMFGDRECYFVGLHSAQLFERLSIVAVAQAAWRAFWRDPNPAGRHRLQRQFLSIIVAFGAYGAAGAARDIVWRPIVATLALVAVTLRTLYISFYSQQPLALAGIAGILVGIAILAFALVLPGLFFGTTAESSSAHPRGSSSAPSSSSGPVAPPPWDDDTASSSSSEGMELLGELLRTLPFFKKPRGAFHDEERERTSPPPASSADL